MEKNGQFFIGRVVDPETNKATTEPLFYDPADLTTHAFVTGMTGSGKTGLSITVLEEAALQKIPAIIIDPKGDLTNLALHFPNLEPKNFEPWLDPETARRENTTLAALAESTAAMWKKGLADWGIGKEDLEALSNAVQFTIFTPGSSSGIPVNILSSFAAPLIPWDENQEILREEIASNVTALLSLIGFNDIDPLSSREHILLSNILENAWSSGQSLDLTGIILQTQAPPFEKLGAFPVNSFFPEKDRFALAMRLNNFLASPSFQTWIEGQPLDIGNILYMPDGKPRHSIFYLAHLSENERMFFVTLLFGAIEAWMRGKRGTSGLRALIYFDEIMGYLPPVANPPSRTIMLRMLKQARAFGVGLLLSSQNPVDLDYKALSNAGTWIIGRLQTDQDKQRLLDGLDSASGGINRAEVDKLLSRLDKRIFLLHNVHTSGLKLFTTRWAMNFLAGPLMRDQIPSLNDLVGATKAVGQTSAQTTPSAQTTVAPKTGVAAGAPTRPSPAGNGMPGSENHPIVPTGVNEFFLPNNLTLLKAVEKAKVNLTGELSAEGFFYQAALIAQAEIRYLSKKYNLEHTRKISTLSTDPDGNLIHWDEYISRTFDPANLAEHPLPQARFADLPGWMSNAKQVVGLQNDYIDWIYRNAAIQIKANDTLKVYAGPEVTTADFRSQCTEAARNALETESKAVEKKYETKISALEKKFARQKMEIKSSEDELSQRRMEELGTGGELLLSFLGKRKKSISSSLTKRRMTQKAKGDLEVEEQELVTLEKDLTALKAEMQAALDQVKERWANSANDITEIPVTALKKDIFVEIFGIAWVPYYLVRSGNEFLPVLAGDIRD